MNDIGAYYVFFSNYFYNFQLISLQQDKVQDKQLKEKLSEQLRSKTKELCALEQKYNLCLQKTKSTTTKHKLEVDKYEKELADSKSEIEKFNNLLKEAVTEKDVVIKELENSQISLEKLKRIYEAEKHQSTSDVCTYFALFFMSFF